MHRFENRLTMPVEKSVLWDFFAQPKNLPRLTPASNQFRFKDELPKYMYQGMVLRYTLKPALGIKASGVTEITNIAVGDYFVDHQLQGPFKQWHHQHHFIRLDKERTEIVDLVHYQLPAGALGNLFGAAFVSKQIKELFAYREEALHKIFARTD